MGLSAAVDSPSIPAPASRRDGKPAALGAGRPAWQQTPPPLTVAQPALASPCLAFFFFFRFLGPHLCHMEIPRLAIKLEPQLRPVPQPDPSCTCDLNRSLRQCWILNPPGKARARTHILMGASRVLNSLSHSRYS